MFRACLRMTPVGLRTDRDLAEVRQIEASFKRHNDSG